LKPHSLEVSYIADKSAASLVKALSIRDGLPYADGKPLPLDNVTKLFLTPTDPTPPPKK
jgi:hypothetical protein